MTLYPIPDDFIRLACSHITHHITDEDTCGTTRTITLTDTHTFTYPADGLLADGSCYWLVTSPVGTVGPVITFT